MNWIEIIELRTGDRVKDMLKQTLLNTVRKKGKVIGFKKIAMYNNAVIVTDISIHIQWKTNQHKVIKSDLGLRIAKALEEYGRVNHSIWIKD